MNPIFDADWSQSDEMFGLLKQALINEKAWHIQLTQGQLALQLLPRLTALLRTGQASQQTLNILADFVQGITDDAGKSKHALGHRLKLANRIFGYEPNGPPSKNLAMALMIAAFKAAKKGGADDEAAERAAYDVYFEREGRTYETDHLDKEAVDRTRAGENLSTAEITMDRVLRTMLRRAGLIGKKQPGPRRKA